MKSFCRLIKKYNPLRKSLYVELFVAILISGLIAILIDIFSIAIAFAVEDSRWYDRNFIQPVLEEKAASLQDYVLDNNLSSTDLKSLKIWYKSNSDRKIGLYIESVDQQEIIYENNFSNIISDLEYYISYESEDVDRSIKEFTVNFTDGTSTVYMISNSAVSYFKTFNFIIGWASFLSFILIFVLIIRRKIKYIQRITDAIRVLENDNLDYEIPEEGSDEITSVAKSLNHMRTTLSKQIESEKKAIQANNSLVTALSHDLRTPLTTQLGYLEILKEQHYTSEEERQEYLDKAIENGKQIKILSDRLFEYFLAFDRNTESLQQREVVDALELFMQLITEHTMYLEEIGFQFLLDEPEEQFFVEVNPEDCMRIFNNIFSNIEKYADKNETVIIRIHHTENQCEISISNRIDRKPKKNESAKVGLESLRALMTRQGGQFKVERNNISFRTVLTFPVKEDHKV